MEEHDKEAKREQVRVDIVNLNQRLTTVGAEQVELGSKITNLLFLLNGAAATALLAKQNINSNKIILCFAFGAYWRNYLVYMCCVTILASIAFTPTH